ncbi:MAG TPA: site-specific integrase, partial [Syntrophales bacterium]|nr:site-specific integrase [Syntrophales bacterium]
KEILELDMKRLHKLLSKKSPQTVKLTLALLRRIVRYGMAKKGIPGLSFSLKLPSVNNEVIETLSEKQMAKLLKALRESGDVQVSHLMLLALYTGMRKGELLKLQWADVDFDTGFIRLREPKGKRDVSIPMNESARELLSKHPRTGNFVFCADSGRQFHDVRKRIERIRIAADLPRDFRPLHGLRQMFATTLANSGEIDIYVLQRLLTHRDVKTTSRYAHLLDQRLKDASAVMDKALKEVG